MSYRKRIASCPHGCGIVDDIKPISDELWEEEGKFLGTKRETTMLSKCHKCGTETIGGYE